MPKSFYKLRLDFVLNRTSQSVATKNLQLSIYYSISCLTIKLPFAGFVTLAMFSCSAVKLKFTVKKLLFFITEF